MILSEYAKARLRLSSGRFEIITAVTHGFPLAICNEVFGKMPLRDVCREVRRLGYDGIELAPFTLAEDASTLSAADRQAIRHTLTDAGLRFVGLHWLLMSPAGLHATSPDRALRDRTWNFIRQMVTLSAELSEVDDRGVIVFGSPKQRAATNGLSSSEAEAIYTEELARIAPYVEASGTTLLVEPLSPDQCDVVTTMAEAVAIVKQIGSPAIQTMFDVHNAKQERDAHVELLARYRQYIRHVHVNEIDGREPGMADYDFPALFSALREVDYRGWVSVEAFDFTREPVSIARRAYETLSAAASASALKPIL